MARVRSVRPSTVAVAMPCGEVQRRRPGHADRVRGEAAGLRHDRPIAVAWNAVAAQRIPLARSCRASAAARQGQTRGEVQNPPDAPPICGEVDGRPKDMNHLVWGYVDDLLSDFFS